MPEEILQILLKIVELVPWPSLANKLEHIETIKGHLPAPAPEAPGAPAGAETEGSGQ